MASKYATFEEWVKQYEGVIDGLHWTDLRLAWDAGIATGEGARANISMAFEINQLKAENERLRAEVERQEGLVQAQADYNVTWIRGLQNDLADARTEIARLNGQVAMTDSLAQTIKNCREEIVRLEEGHDEAVRRMDDGDWMQGLIVLKDLAAARFVEVATAPVGDYTGRMRAKADAARRKHGR